MPQKRSVSIDLVKTIAIIGVVVIHTCSAGYQNPLLSANWLSSVFWGCISRASVPLFFMCSGALLLAPEKPLSLKKLYTRNLLRIVLSLFFWALCYKAYHLIISDSLNAAALLQAAKDLLLFRHEYHLYFLHILMMVYVLLPIVRVFTRHASRTELCYTLILWFGLGIAYPTLRPYWPLSQLSGIPSQWMLNMTYAAIGYGLLGHDIYRCHIFKNRGIRWLLSAGIFTLLFSVTVLLSARNGKLHTAALEGMSIGVCLYATSIFSLCCPLEHRFSELAAMRLRKISDASFCIYLVHVFYTYLFGALGLTVQLFPCLFSIPLLSLLNLALSYGTYLILRRIPFVKKWLI